jgi:hypothetical protein
VDIVLGVAEVPEINLARSQNAAFSITESNTASFVLNFRVGDMMALKNTIRLSPISDNLVILHAREK